MLFFCFIFSLFCNIFDKNDYLCSELYITMGEERLLLQQLKDGSYDSFKALYERWVARLYQFALKLTKSESMAQEIVQESFIKIWEKHESINPEQSFKSFLFTIAYHKSINHFRTQIRQPLMGDYLEYTSALADEHTADQHLSMELFLRRLEEAKKKLTPRQRELFELSKEQDLSNAEIEERLGISNQAVRNRIAAAVKIIREEMKDYLPLLLLYFQL